MDRIKKKKKKKIDSIATSNWKHNLNMRSSLETSSLRILIIDSIYQPGDQKNRKISTNSTKWNQSLVNMENLLLLLLVNPVCNNGDASTSAKMHRVPCNAYPFFHFLFLAQEDSPPLCKVDEWRWRRIIFFKRTFCESNTLIMMDTKEWDKLVNRIGFI